MCEMSNNILHTQDFSVVLDGAEVLRHVSIDVRQGSCTALLGPNGSGKTTFLKAILGLLPVSSGAVTWLGDADTSYHHSQRISLVPQLLPGSIAVPVSVAEFVESAFTSPRNRWRRFSMRDTRRTALRDALVKVDLLHKANKPIDALSGGEQRRALFARAIVTGADVILLDEPLAGVDLEHQAGLVTLMQSLLRSGATLIIVAHELDAIAHLVDQVVLFGGTDQSSVAYQGAPSPDVLRNHVLHEPHHAHELIAQETSPTLLEM
jgi:zinc transport system ATP-binding protein